MPRLSDDSVLTIFYDLPGHRGCSDAELRAAELEMTVTFPMSYRRMMLLDANRLYGTGVFLPPNELAGYNIDAPDIADPLESTFTRPRIIFGIDDIRAFYAMDAVGGDDSAVYEFDHYTGCGPTRIFDSFLTFVAGVLRGYLKL